MNQTTVPEQRRMVMLIVAVATVLVLAVVVMALGLNYKSTQQQPLATVEREVITNSIGMKLVSIPAGSFVMGEDAPGRGPQRPIEVSPFYIGVFEVTQAQFYEVLSVNPSEFKDPRRPLEQATWLEVQAFLEELNRREGTNKYRLPTEVEWEYAARAGTEGRYFFGNDVGLLGRYAWFGSQKGTRPVGSKAPNPWGLYDVYGNVWEWVQDCWHENYVGAPANSRVWGGGDCGRRVLRGGGWGNAADYLDSTVRGSYASNDEDASNGFRVVLSP